MKGTAVFVIVLLSGLLAASGCVSGPTSPAPAATTPALQEGRPHYVIGVDGDYPPFTYRDSTGNFTGFDIEAARWIADRQGFDAEFVAVQWDRIIPALQAGTIDMIYSAMTITPERQRNVDFTMPYYTVYKRIAIRSGSNITMADLYGGRVRIGAQAGTTGAAWVEENMVQSGNMPAANLVLYPDLPALTGSLANGTIDAFISDAPTQTRAIAGKPLTIIGEIPTKEQYAIAVRKTTPQIRVMMDSGLRQLREDPYWQQLLQKYDL
jgi:polar amino acid transport system substrate-binding protein